MFISKGFTGNERILIEIFKKLFPDEKNLNLTNFDTMGKEDLVAFVLKLMEKK